MPKKEIHPSSLDGIKRLAKNIKRNENIKHYIALDKASIEAGFNNFNHARNSLHLDNPRITEITLYDLFITSYWQDPQKNSSGRETLVFKLSKPWQEVISPRQMRYLRAFANFSSESSDHIVFKYTRTQSSARSAVCAVANTFLFMNATNLLPSKKHNPGYPKGDYRGIPGQDHVSVWYDPNTKRYVIVDEPYEKAVENIMNQRSIWAEKYNYAMLKPNWPGMYNPEGGSRVYLFADKNKGLDIEPIVAALNKLPLPYTEQTWQGESAPMFPYFISPATFEKNALLNKNRKKRSKIPQKPYGKINTVAYSTIFSGTKSYRRPNARMPIEAHIQIGQLLKTVIAISYGRKGIFNRINYIRGELDDWVQCEYNHTELPNEQFFDLYYHGLDSVLDNRRLSPEKKEYYANNLHQAKTILAEHYPDCPPLRALMKKFDLAISSLQNWKT